MTSVLNVDTIADKAGTGPVGLTKQAGVKMYTKTSGTYTGLSSDSLNAASLTDGGTGVVTISFTNSFTTNNYCVTACIDATGAKCITYTSEATGSIQHRVHDDDGSDSDNNCTSTATGDLA